MLAGPNGCGKTSALFAIANALRGPFGSRLEDVPQPSRDDLRGPGPDWTPRVPVARVDVEIVFSDNEEADIREALAILGKEEPPSLPDRKLTVTWGYPPPLDEDGRRLPDHHTSFDPPLANVRSWLAAKRWAIRGWKDRVPGIGPLVSRLGGLHFFPQDRDLRHRIGLGPNGPNGGASQRPTVNEVLDDFSRRFAGKDSLDPGNWESTIKRMYASICSPREYEGFLYRNDALEGEPVFRHGDRKYPLSRAASGEHVILEYIIELYRYGPMNRSIVLIDEPEVHLHPQWLRRLYFRLGDFGEDNQFIMTTHSPEMRQRAAADNRLTDMGSVEELS